MAEEPGKTSSWWGTIPGVLTATAGVITAITGLVAILSQTGVFGENSKAFVSQKASDVRDAMSSPTTATAPKVDVAKPSGPAPVAIKEDAATGIATTPLHAAPFTGAVITLLDGSVVKLRGDVNEYCQGRPTLQALNGQLIEMQRIRRFELSDWNARDARGSAHITLNNGEAMDLQIKGCFIVGDNDLGHYSGPFETIRSVEFIR